MGVFSLQSSGAYSLTNTSLERLLHLGVFKKLDLYGRMGVVLLENATPKESGETAGSWEYEVRKTSYGYEISWYNTHENEGQNIAVLLQYGHGTGTGGYVQGIDYINPAITTLFDAIVLELEGEVKYGNR